MMKSQLLKVVGAMLLSTGLLAQTIVNTSPENRKVILEEFTGIYCGYCPDGHAIAQGIKDANPNNVFLINIHQGSFANPLGSDPDFMTLWGDGIANQTGLLGYPAGTVNRRNFPGIEMGDAGTTALGRNNWEQATNTVLSESSYVNLAVEATVDIPTNSINIHVEGYYTDDSPEATNMLNVAILQNNTLGPQSGGGQGNNYNHQHRLIDLVTGQWGEEIATTTAGSFIDRTYNYTLPIDVNGIYIEHSQLDIVVYMAESSQNIISGNETTPNVNAITATNDASILGLKEIRSECGINTLAPEVVVLNAGLDPLTSLNFTYNANGGAEQNYIWNGTLYPLQTVYVQLPDIDYTSQAINTIEVVISNDDFNENNVSTYSFDQIIDASNDVTLTVITDQYAGEISWAFIATDGTLLESQELTAADNNQTLEFYYTLPEDCITFFVYDSYGDGILNGGIELVDNGGIEIFPYSGSYGDGASKPFNSNEILSINDEDFAEILVFPNPTKNIVTIVNAQTAHIEVYDILGKRVASKANIDIREELRVSNLTAGTYFIKIYLGTSLTTKKFIVSK